MQDVSVSTPGQSKQIHAGVVCPFQMTGLPFVAGMMQPIQQPPPLPTPVPQQPVTQPEAIDYVKLAQTMITLQQQSPLAQPVLPTTINQQASQNGSNGSSQNGHNQKQS